MQKVGFAERLDGVVEKDPRFSRDAYLFLRDALEFTIKQKKKGKSETTQQHVNAGELMDGVRQYALKEFGPMVLTVFEYWGVKSCEDVGQMVFNLIEAGIFGKTEKDHIDDFKKGFDFEEAFVRPFRPEPKSVEFAPDMPSNN